MKTDDKLILGMIGVCIAAIIVLGTILLIPGSPTGNAVDEKPQLDHVRVGYKATSHYVIMMVAKDKGFFEEQGLDAELIRFDSSNQVMDALLAGQLDVARGGIVLQLIIEDKQPGTIKTVTFNKQTQDNYIDYLIARKDSGIKTIGDLEGKRIGFNMGYIDEVLLKVILKNASVEDYDLMGMKPEILAAALESKQVDAIFSYEPEATIALNKMDSVIVEKSLFTYRISDPFMSGGAFMTTSFMNENPEIADRIIRALYRTGEFMKENPEECKQIIAKYVGMDQATADQLHVLEDGRPTPELMDAAQIQSDIMYENGVLSKRINVSSIMYAIT